ncbi:MAG TPA: tetraacyldisaccharide 4'-kinase [Sulfurovum sp. UBA12169]|nr:MAG TPA: tetraacyldisaccharide 4'-kinase [Sulfurovum sp. UBA12169]
MSLMHFFETLFFAPRWYHYLFIALLSPFAIGYGIVMSIRRSFTKKKKFDIPIVSVGNLVVGGSGKTPFVIALASRYKHATIISRGYGRQSKGLIEISKEGRILADVHQSGDEPMLMAQSLPECSVIVSEDRYKAIRFAINQGAKLIILDDGFNRMEIEKFEILLEPSSIQNILPFPAGPMREFYFNRKYADVIAKEQNDFIRHVSIQNPTSKMVLVTAISNPQRLEPYLPKVEIVAKIYFQDHAYFEESALKKILKQYEATSLLCTSKDKVKMKGFKLPISEMKLKLEIKNHIFESVDIYIKKSIKKD